MAERKIEIHIQHSFCSFFLFLSLSVPPVLSLSVYIYFHVCIVVFLSICPFILSILSVFPSLSIGLYASVVLIHYCTPFCMTKKRRKKYIHQYFSFQWSNLFCQENNKYHNYVVVMAHRNYLR